MGSSEQVFELNSKEAWAAASQLLEEKIDSWLEGQPRHLCIVGIRPAIQFRGASIREFGKDCGAISITVEKTGRKRLHQFYTDNNGLAEMQAGRVAKWFFAQSKEPSLLDDDISILYRVNMLKHPNILFDIALSNQD